MLINRFTTRITVQLIELATSLYSLMGHSAGIRGTVLYVVTSDPLNINFSCSTATRYDPSGFVSWSSNGGKVHGRFKGKGFFLVGGIYSTNIRLTNHYEIV